MRFAFLLFALLLPFGTRAAEREKMVVLEIRAERVDAALKNLLEPIIHGEIARRYDVIGNSDVQELVGLEQKKQLLGCGEESSCLAEIGGALGARWVTSGNIGKVGALYVVNLRLVDAQKAKVLERVTETIDGPEEQLVAGVQRAVRRLLHIEEPPAPVAAAPKPVPVVVTPKVAPVVEAPVEAPEEELVAEPEPTPPAQFTVVRVERSNALPWTGVALGLATAAVGGWFGYSALETAEAARTTLKNPTPDGAHLVTYAAQEAKHGDQALYANVLVGSGIGLAFVSWLFVRDVPGDGGDAPRVLVGPNGVTVAGELP